MSAVGNVKPWKTNPDRWRVRVTVGTDPFTGRRKVLSSIVEAKHNKVGERLADEELARLTMKAAEIRRDYQAAPDNMTFAEGADRWMKHKIGDWAGKTIEANRRALFLVLPAIGQRPVKTLGVGDLERLYGQLEREGVDLNSIRQAHTAISGTLALAVHWGSLTANPALSARPRRPAAPEVNPPEPEAVASAIVAMLGSDSEADVAMGAFIALAASTGMRRGELCGLRWSDVDLATSSLTIHQQIAMLPGGTWGPTPTKTKTRKRITLPAAAVAALLVMSTRIEQQAEIQSVELPPDGWVFSIDPIGQPDRHPLPATWGHRWSKTSAVPGSTKGERTKATRDRFGLPGVKLHHLRHFHASTLVAAGVDPVTVAARLTHSNPRMLLERYAHFAPAADIAAADIIDRVLGQTVANATP